MLMDIRVPSAVRCSLRGMGSLASFSLCSSLIAAELQFSEVAVQDLHPFENAPAQVISSQGLWEGEFTVDQAQGRGWYQLVLRSSDATKVLARTDINLMIRDMIALKDGGVALVGTRTMKIPDLSGSQSDLEIDPALKKLHDEIFGDPEHSHHDDEESIGPKDEENLVEAADYEGQVDFLAVARLNNQGKIVVQEWRFGPDYALSGLAEKDGIFYLSEKGIRRVLEFNPQNRKVKALNFEVSGPTSLYSVKDKIWIVEARAPDATSFLVSYQPNTGAFQRHKFPETPLNGITKLIVAEDQVHAAVLVMRMNMVANLNLETGKIESIAQVTPQGLRDATAVGSCILAVQHQQQMLSLIDLKSMSEIATYQISSQNKEKLKNVRNISYEPKSNLFYLRSTYPCPSCSVTQSSIYAFSETSGLIKDSCL